MPSDKFDENARYFIEHQVKSSTSFKMKVLGIDVEDRLHILLYLKQGSNKYICLNDKLCELNHARVINSSSVALAEIEQGGPNFWEKLPLLLMQNLLEERLSSHTVGFSDYANSFKEKRKEKSKLKHGQDVNLSKSSDMESSSSSPSLYSSPVNREEDLEIVEPLDNVQRNLNSVSSNSSDNSTPLSFARGRNFQMMKDHLFRQKKQLDQTPRELPPLVWLTSEISPKQPEVKKVDTIPTTLDELETLADRATKRHIPPPVQTSNSSPSKSSSIRSYSSSSTESAIGIQKLNNDKSNDRPSLGRGTLGRLLCPAEYVGNTQMGWFERNNPGNNYCDAYYTSIF